MKDLINKMERGYTIKPKILVWIPKEGALAKILSIIFKTPLKAAAKQTPYIATIVIQVMLTNVQLILN